MLKGVQFYLLEIQEQLAVSVIIRHTRYAIGLYKYIATGPNIALVYVRI